MSPRSVHLHIEQLVLEGFGPGSGPRIADGLARELQRLIGERLPGNWKGQIEALRGPPVAIPAAAPERLGERIAASIHGAEEPALPATGGARRAQHPAEEPALPATGGARRAQHPAEAPR
ncbi:MAG TPA: hypothetical protein VFL36_16815 [Myxococcales bacterium]|nr:hypothetical protein [Myxococcales bacterium]